MTPPVFARGPPPPGTDTRTGPGKAAERATSLLGADLGVRGHVFEQARVVGTVAPVGGVGHGAGARVFGAHAVFPGGRQTLGDEALVHLGHEARDAATLARGG